MYICMYFIVYVCNMESNPRTAELKRMYDYVRKVCCCTGCKKYEGVPLDEKWKTFEGFLKDNWFRYYRAKVKWKGYKRVIVRKDRPAKPLVNNNLRLTRKVKEGGYTKENTVFTSPSDCMKYSKATHKYMFEGKLLGTRDIKNILKKRGISLSMEMIVTRLNSGMDLFSTNERSKIKWKGKQRSYVEIAEMEGVSLALLKHRNTRVNDIKKSLDYCRQWDGFSTYDFEGKNLRKFEICEIIAERTGISDTTILGRFTKHGMNLSMLLLPLGAKPSLCKKVYVIKNGTESEFSSIEDAAKTLGISAGNISLAANGKYIHCGGYKVRFEGGQYNTSEILVGDEKMDVIRGEAMRRSKARHASKTRHCQVCDKTKDKKDFAPRNFRRCRECVLRDKGIKNVGQQKERDEKFKLGLLWCGDCGGYKPFSEFNKSGYARGFAHICRVHSKKRAMLKKYGSEEVHQGQQALNLLKAKIREQI